MKVLLLKPQDAGRPRKGCAYEEWNEKVHTLTHCDLPPSVKFGNKNLCAEHAACAIAAASEADYFDADGNVIPTGAEFVQILRRTQA